MTFTEHQLVRLTRALPEVGLVVGAVGAVVGVYGNGGYEVEFTDNTGATAAVATLSEADLRPVD